MTPARAPATPPTADNERVRAALTLYAEPLLREVANRLAKPRNHWPADELIARVLATLTNAPVLDRRLRELPAAARLVLAVMGSSGLHRWRVGHLLAVLAALGHSEGAAPVLELLGTGLLYPDPATGEARVRDFESRLGGPELARAFVWAHPFVARRVPVEPGDSPDLPGADSLGPPGRLADGLEWPLRLSIVRQQVEADPIRLTMNQALFKRDITRLQADAALNAPVADAPAAAPDLGLLALSLARASGLLAPGEQGLEAGPFPAAWAEGWLPALRHLASAAWRVEDWDPLLGGLGEADPESPAPSVGWLALLLLSRQPGDGWLSPRTLSDWLLERHPAWGPRLGRDPERAARWLGHWLAGVAFALQLVEARGGGDGWDVRLSPLGRHLFAGGPEPAAPPEFRQTLLVQPNNEVLAFRQGMTPKLVSQLTRFARWKSLSSACLFELDAEQVYRGLEAGLTLTDVTQILSQHGMKPVPPVVLDALQRWSKKRERIAVYASATLIEFTTPDDLAAALGRGLIEARITDRIGLVSSADAIDYKNFRLIGNRDYENRPQQCVTFDADGVTFAVDVAQADLLLEAELARVAEPLGAPGVGQRRYRLTPATVGRAEAAGVRATDLDLWCQERAGRPLSPAARLLFRRPAASAGLVLTRVVSFEDSALADGVWQWPETRRWLAERLGPLHFSVAVEDVEGLRAALVGVGIDLGRLEAGAAGG